LFGKPTLWKNVEENPMESKKERASKGFKRMDLKQHPAPNNSLKRRSQPARQKIEMPSGNTEEERQKKDSKN